MAYYNANEMVRLTRIAKGITQEELCFGICDVSTLSKMENGHFKIKQTTYHKLMEKMGRMPEKRYAILLDKEGRISEDRTEWERAYKSQDYEEAEKHLRKMKESADDNLLTKQYLVRAEALIDYRLKRISADELINRIDAAIRITVPEYEKYLGQEKVFPFVKEELLTLMSLGNAYRKVGKCEQSIQIYERILKCLNTGYINEPDSSTMAITVKYNVIRMHTAMGKHVEALAECDECLRLCKERDYSSILLSFLTAKAHNYVRLVEKGQLGEEGLSIAKKLLQQAYGLAIARADNIAQVEISAHYAKHLTEICN